MFILDLDNTEEAVDISDEDASIRVMKVQYEILIINYQCIYVLKIIIFLYIDSNSNIYYI